MALPKAARLIAMAMALEPRAAATWVAAMVAAAPGLEYTG